MRARASPLVPNQRTGGVRLRRARPEQGLGVGLSIPDEEVQPQPPSRPCGRATNRKLGHAHLVLKWFFARKGTAKPHFSINTFPTRSLALSLALSPTLTLCLPRLLVWMGPPQRAED